MMMCSSFTHYSLRALRLTCLTLAGPLFALSAKADVDTCVEAHSQGQILRDEGRLLAAQAEFLTCVTDEACPAPVKEECEQHLNAVKQATPTVVFAARDDIGRDLDGVRVFLDGEFLADVDGSSPVPINPGPHEMRFEHLDGRVVEQKLVAVQGEHARFVVAKFSSPRRPAPKTDVAPATAEPSDLRRVATYVFGGLAVVGLGGFAAFGLQGRGEESDLRSSCAPNCTAAQKRSVAQKYMLADVSLAVAGLSLAGGAVLYFAPLPVAEGQTASLSVRGKF